MSDVVKGMKEAVRHARGETVENVPALRRRIKHLEDQLARNIVKEAESLKAGHRRQEERRDFERWQSEKTKDERIAELQVLLFRARKYVVLAPLSMDSAELIEGIDGVLEFVKVEEDESQ